MVDICRRKFPGMEFVEASATSLPMLTDASFDCVFFAFNGIDYIVPRKQREACLLECRRVLRKGGLLIFSSHNPRAVVERLSWNAERAGQFTSDLADQTGISTTLMLPLVMGARIATACISAVCGTLRRIGRRLPTKAFWSGEGYLFDPAHGGLQTHYCIPECAISELEGLGFRHLGTKGDDYPRPSHRYITDWYYYVFAKCE
jgi:SAM-dependent methyltransferase